MDERKSNIRTSEKVLRSVVKLFVQLSTPNYSMPWQMKRQQQVFGSGFIISGRRILTNGHVVAYQKSVRVRKHGDARKYNAHVIHVGHECDIAMLGVSDEKFWENLDPLEFGDIPKLEEDVVCVGFPTGGDNISVTRGVVSRVEIQRYAHSAVELLAIQIDAAINSGNSGGPALKDDKLIGIAFETLDNAENIGYIIPVTVINHFLEDIQRNGTYHGFCRLGIKWQPIESEHMRSYFKLATEQTGVLVTKVLPLFTSDGVLKRGDVLMAIDGETIADNGTVHFRGNERILFDYALSHKYVGDACKVQILRKGEVLGVEVKMSLVTSLVPTQLYDKRPSYLVFAGVVFVTLSQPYMQHQYGKDWARKAPIRLCDRALYGILEKPGQEVILLSQILASELTTGYENMSNLQLFKVNGIPVLNLKHLAVLLDEIVKPYINKKVDVTSQSKDGGVAMDTECHEDEGGVKNTSTIERTCEDESVSLKVFDEEARMSDRTRSTAESRTDLSRNDRDSAVGACTVAQGSCGISPKQMPPSSVKGYQFNLSEANPLDGVYMGLKEDPTLLNWNDYLHFELDKDKVVVLQISAAYKASAEILKQYAIGTPRSDDLPPPP